MMVWIAILAAILYNPIIQIHLNRAAWKGINVGTILFSVAVVICCFIGTRQKEK